MERDINFKFKFVLNGAAQGVFSSKKGCATPTGLTLAGSELGYELVADTIHRDNRLVVAITDIHQLDPGLVPQVQDRTLVLECYNTKLDQLEKFIDCHASAYAAKRHKQALEAQGEGHLFRTEICPLCSATVDLSGFEQGKYVYCRFCDSVYGEGMERLSAKNSYQECDECHMFDRIQGYTEFYFYFLLVVYGFSHQRRHLCDSCAAKLFWKVFLANSIFILGVPSAIWLGAKSRMGRDPELSELSKANNLAKGKKVEQATAIYDRLRQRFREHPGLLMNEGIAYLKAGDAQHGVQCLERSLSACPNYLPTLRWIALLSESADG